jgi:hypothetical protein
VPVLTVVEADVRDIIRRLEAVAKDPSVGIRVHEIRWESLNHPVSLPLRYDQVNRALKSLVEKGLAERPRRGFYRSVP